MTWVSAQLAREVFDTLRRTDEEGRTALSKTISKVVRAPIKAVAAFLFAPVLAVRIAYLAKNPVRRFIAAGGLLISVLCAYLAGTLLGTAAGALLVATKINWLAGFGFFIGTTMSVVLSVAFSLVVLNSLSLVFVQVSSEEVLDYLKSISQ